MPKLKLCSIEGCDKPIFSRRWCAAHYTRWQRHGDPRGGGKNQTKKGEPMQFVREIAMKFAGIECLPWPYNRNSKGYGMIWENNSPVIVNRIICEKTHGPAPTPEHEAAHSCGNGNLVCCNPNHLRWATRSENFADKNIHGTQTRGEQCPWHKLSEEEVLSIRSLSGLVKQRDIANRFGITQSTVGSIIRREIWTHI